MKVQVNINDDLVMEIDRFAEYLGVSRSSLCCLMIGHGMSYYRNILEDNKGSVEGPKPE